LLIGAVLLVVSVLTWRWLARTPTEAERQGEGQDPRFGTITLRTAQLYIPAGKKKWDARSPPIFKQR
jgi:hypothetical protein